MSHFSPVPPGERVYAKNYRKELEPHEAQLVETSGRVKEFREHPERKDLESVLLVNVEIRPVGVRKLIKLSHLWVLSKHLRRAGINPVKGRRCRFIGSVYSYFRVGGKSKQRGLFGSHDFSILPMESTEVQTFEPGIENRYEDKNSGTYSGGKGSDEGRDGDLGEGKTRRSKNRNRGRRDNGSSKPRSKDRSGKRISNRQSGKGDSRSIGESQSSDSDGCPEGTRN